MLARLPIPRKTEIRREYALSQLLEGLVRLNTHLIALHNLPSIYDGGIRYAINKDETWKHALMLHRHGFGDCDNLAATRAAELRLDGIPAIVVVKRTGPRTLHAIVALPDGTFEDPSIALGMTGRY